MGDLQACAQQPTGVSTNPSPSQLLSSSSSSPSNPPPLSIDAECLRRGEEQARAIIHRVQPTLASEQKRQAVIEYIQWLFRSYLRCEVFPFGSVPLKTYLPDGDIDLTAVCSLNVDEALADEVRFFLEKEEQEPSGAFEVKDVQYIHAEVKLVKCLIQNIVIDISFNQLGGLSTLCFLEQVDHVIGKDHLFKRSIILIKAWCYYESRILGAHHGLISTYALETLVLYIFHLFHSSLHGPLAVLYRFLDYFSKFDWENYCISLHGPVAISSLPEIVAETPQTDGGELLLSKEFLNNCLETFSVPPKGGETPPRPFPRKHLNIIDPMKDNNNLGRSVSRGNFYRIRSAFTYGVRKLGRILLLPEEDIGDELKNFFQNTLDRHGYWQRPDVQDSARPAILSVSGVVPLSSKTSNGEKLCEEKLQNKNPESSLVDSSRIATGGNRVDYKRALTENLKNIKISGSEMKKERGKKMQSHSKSFGCPVAAEVDSFKERFAVSGSRLAGDAQDLATLQNLGSRLANETCKLSTSTSEVYNLPVQRIHQAPHLSISSQFSENGMALHKNQVNLSKPGMLQTESSVDESLDENRLQDPSMNSVGSKMDNSKFLSSNTDAAKELYEVKPFFTSRYSSVTCGNDLEGLTGSDDLSSLSDLSGDLDNHRRSLCYGIYCHEYVWSMSFLPVQPSSSSGYGSQPWDFSGESPGSFAALKQGAFPHVRLNGVVPVPQFPSGAAYCITPFFPGAAFKVQEMPKRRGTGTYFPNMNHRSYRERQSPGRGRRGPMSVPLLANNNQLPRSRKSGRSGNQADSMAKSEKGNHEPPAAPQLQLPAFYGAGRGKPSEAEFVPAHRSLGRGLPHANGFTIPPERPEFGNFCSGQLGGGALPDWVRHVNSGNLKHSNDSEPIPTTMARTKLEAKEESDSQAYRLKDDEDFPPLSVRVR